MNSLLVDLRRHYQQLLLDREVIEKNLLQLRELISFNEGHEKNREDENKGESRPVVNTTMRPDNNHKATRIPPANTINIPKPPIDPASAPTSQPDLGYHEHLPWQRKILYVMTEMDRPATAREIAARIRELEPGSTQSIGKSVELTTSRMNIAGEISARKEGVKNFYFLKSN